MNVRPILHALPTVVPESVAPASQHGLERRVDLERPAKQAQWALREPILLERRELFDEIKKGVDQMCCRVEAYHAPAVLP